MKRWLVVLGGIAALALLAIGLTGAPSANNPTVVRIEGGKIRGTAANDMLVFKGIPFAQPPVGALRWRSPQPVKPWQGIRNATAFSPDPMQPANLASPGTTVSEDCLYANVWRPVSNGKQPLPVMVWIFGGALVKGGATPYIGEFLARQGILFVSFNYRLGRLGFFAHPALARESPDDPRGNYGYMDQIALLKWVQRNIAAFGGDPNQVTLAGESAGGGAVLVHLTSPLAKGLFHRAILESPGIPTPRANAAKMRSLEAAESIAVEYTASNGITGDDTAVLAALRALSTETLTAGLDNYALAVFDGPQISGLSHSIIDGRLVVDDPESVLRAGQQAMVPIITGANNRDLAVSPAQTKDALFAKFGALSSQARALYDPTGSATFADVLQNVCADFGMLEPSRNLAEWMTRAGQPAYFYRFSYVPVALRETLPGAPHALEIVFAFDGVDVFFKEQATAEDQEMAKTMSGYWVAFVKTGDPNGDGRTVWPRFNPASREVLNFTNTGVVYGPDPVKDRLDLWRSVWENR